MCGICGLMQTSGNRVEDPRATISKMAASMAHRGPDSQGLWVSGDNRIALGHRRLAILDLSQAGNQPMISADGRYVIAYNGEIYNHYSLRKELDLQGNAFLGSSDTETLLAAISQWGLIEAVRKCVGMFAFALWDTEKGQLHLVRDRIGIKPLFYGTVENDFVFGSELKALRALPEFRNEIDRNALALFFRHSYIPSPHSIYTNINKLPPGTILTTDGEGAPRIQAYWSAKDIWGNAASFPDTAEKAADRLEELLFDAVKIRMLADVPVGAFLSGGIDSSTVVALMQRASMSPVKTFSIGFHEERFNEAPSAARIARHLGTDHTEFYVTPEEMMQVIPSLPDLWDEPFGDSSQVPTYLLSKLTREEVSVALSGDGGDELFQGYAHYQHLLGAWGKITSVPTPLRLLISKVGIHGLSRLLHEPPPFSSPTLKRLRLLGFESFQPFYRHAISRDAYPESLVIGSREPCYGLTEDYSQLDLDELQMMSFMDVLTYLPEDILTKVDRASMGVSLEARVPILDHRVVEFAASLPPSMNVRGGSGKRVLRQVLGRYVPENLYERPKMGFGIPLGDWLQNRLQDWAESLLAPKRIKAQGYLDNEAVQRLWMQFTQGDRDKADQVWNVLMFQAWIENNSSSMDS